MAVAWEELPATAWWRSATGGLAGGAPSPLAPWEGLLGGTSAAALYTWNHAWGDPWLASFGGSTARAEGGAPAAWTAAGMANAPESWLDLLRSAGWQYMSATGAPDTQQRVDAQAAAGDEGACKAACYQRYGLSCLPALEGTRLECACVRACHLNPSGGGLAVTLGSLGPVLLIGGAVLLAVLVLK